MKIINNFIKSEYFIYLASFILLVLTFPKIGFPVEPGLDPSYIFAFNYFFNKGVSVGKDIIFSYGPLGFLMFPQAMGNNLLIAGVVFSIIKFLFIWLCLTLGIGEVKTAGKKKILFTFLLTFIISNLVEHRYYFMYFLPFTVAFCLVYYWQKKKPAFLFIAALTAAFAGLTMMPNLVGTLAALAGFIIFMLAYGTKKIIARKSKIKKILKEIIPPVLSVILSYGIFFVLSYGAANRGLGGISIFLTSRMEIAVGNSAAMALGNLDFIDYLFVSIVFYLVSFLSLEKSSSKLYFLIFIFPITTIIKYAFSRQDLGHVLYLFEYLSIFYIGILLLEGHIRLKNITPMVTSLAILIIYLNNTNQVDIDYVRSLGYRMMNIDLGNHFLTATLASSNLNKELRNTSNIKLQPMVLPEAIIKKASQNTIDIYPWEASFVSANNLNWRPRPVFQSYHAYTPWLDRQNSNFLLSSQAPDYLLWHKNHWGGEMGSIDGRYLPNDEPETFYTLVNNYKIDVDTDNTALLKKSSQPIFGQPASLKTEAGSWNQWLTVPDYRSGGILRAKIRTSRTMMGNLVKTALKEKESFIEYDTGDKIQKYRLVIEQLEEGIWVSPFLDRLTAGIDGLTTRKIRLVQPDHSIFVPKIEVNWLYYPKL